MSKEDMAIVERICGMLGRERDYQALGLFLQMVMAYERERLSMAKMPKNNAEAMAMCDKVDPQ